MHELCGIAAECLGKRAVTETCIVKAYSMTHFHNASCCLVGLRSASSQCLASGLCLYHQVLCSTAPWQGNCRATRLQMLQDEGSKASGEPHCVEACVHQRPGASPQNSPHWCMRHAPDLQAQHQISIAGLTCSASWTGVCKKQSGDNYNNNILNNHMWQWQGQNTSSKSQSGDQGHADGGQHVYAAIDITASACQAASQVSCQG